MKKFSPWMLVVFCAVLVACGLLRPDIPVGSGVASALGLYAPEVGLGRPVSETIDRMPGLTLADYVGYEAVDYEANDGFGDLLVVVEDSERWAGSEGDSPPAHYRVSAAVVFAQDEENARRAEQRLRDLLGTPVELCWREVWGGLNRLLYWTDEAGGAVQLIVPEGPWKYRGGDVNGERVVRRRASLTMTIETVLKLVDTYATCEEAPQPDPWRFSLEPAPGLGA